MIHADLIDLLDGAVRTARHPLRSHDFSSGRVERHGSPEELEARIAGWLRAKDPEAVSCGLANALYWLSQRDGEGAERIYEFRAKVSPLALVEALRLFDWLDGPGVVRIARLELPVFRDLWTIGALRMLLDPVRYACVTPTLLELRGLPGRGVLHDLLLDGGVPGTGLRNEGVYERWCGACRALGAELAATGRPAGAARVERGLEELVRRGEIREASLLLLGGEQLAARRG